MRELESASNVFSEHLRGRDCLRDEGVIGTSYLEDSATG
jgi:hypothetical protein